MGWKRHIPAPIKRVYWNLRDRKMVGRYGSESLKHAHELRYWEEQLQRKDRPNLDGYYSSAMLGMAGESDQSFLRGKIVADFGCGPCGSLWWANEARLRIGIDVLVDQYSRFNIAAHDMCYVRSTEESIPLATGYVDVLFTLNAIDHVANFPKMCAELLRILAPGGTFIGSFNLNEPATESEPQTLTPALVDRHLLSHLQVESYRLVPFGPPGNVYKFCRETEPPTPHQREHSVLWARAIKPK